MMASVLSPMANGSIRLVLQTNPCQLISHLQSHFPSSDPWRLLSTTSTFFYQTSGRSRRRHRLRQNHGEGGLLRGAMRAYDESDGQQLKPSKEIKDTRTVRDILFPGYGFGDVPEEHRIKWPKSLSQWWHVLTSAWRAYKSTWEGFFSSRGFLVEDSTIPESENHGEDVREKVRETGKGIADNVKRNAQLLRSEGEAFRTEVRDRTGIHSKDDLKKFTTDMMKLFSDCVNEFMAGYRKGRDDEVEKMLTEYFQELEKEANKPRKRKRKRRVLAV